MGYLQGGLSTGRRGRAIAGFCWRAASRRRFERRLTGRLTEVALGYQRTLLENPCDAKRWRHELVALASRQPQAAVRMARLPSPRRRRWWRLVTLGQAQRFRPGGRVGARLSAGIRLDGRNAWPHRLGELKIAPDGEERSSIRAGAARQPTLVAAHMAWAMRWPHRGAMRRLWSATAGALAAARLAEGEFAAGFVLGRWQGKERSPLRRRSCCGRILPPPG